MIPTFLGLGSALFWGLSDFIAGVASKRFAALWVTLGMELVGLLIVLPIALIGGWPMPSLGILGVAVIAGVCGASSLALLFHAFAIGKMSIAAPLAATGAAVPVIFGFVIGEVPSSLQFVGIAAAMVGVVLAVREVEEQDEKASKDQRLSVIYALVSAVGFGVFFLLIDPVAEHGVVWSLVGTRLGAVPAMMLVVFAVHKRDGIRAPGRKDIPTLLLLGVVDISANGLYAWSTIDGLVSVVAVLGSLYPVTTVVLAHFILKERIEPLQRIGILCALSGAAVIGLG